MTAMTERPTIVGAFVDRAAAQRAIADLKAAGFREDQIGVSSRDEMRRGDLGDGDGSARTAASGEDSYAGEGGLAGLATGAGVGALWGLGIISGVLPAIGPAIAGGALASVISSAVAGAVAAGIAGTLIGMGVPKEEAEFYEGEVKAGRTIVTVTSEGRAAEALNILRRHGGYDMHNRSAAAHTGMEGKQPMAAHPSHSALQEHEGCCGTSAAGKPMAGVSTGSCSTPAAGMAGSKTTSRHPMTHQGTCHPGTSASLAGDQTGRTVQAREEELHVDKRRQKAGEVQIRKEVHTEHKTIDVPVEREEVVIQRRPASGQPASSAPLADGQTIRVPVTEEHVEVTKTPVVKEEVSVGKRKTKNVKRVGGDVRKEEIKVERRGDVNVRDERG